MRCRGRSALELMTGICKMFSDIVKLQKLYLSMLSCPDANGDWTGSFDVDYNLDDEKLDSNQLNYIDPSMGNYDNHWSTTFTVDTCSG
mmetsp:Transcript_32879/g.103967  ORF Transcript_32879/g.103967 Transcript_32879/m.103967 type:complete len:88 (+) Transcript_32879:506-769(+)